APPKGARTRREVWHSGRGGHRRVVPRVRGSFLHHGPGFRHRWRHGNGSLTLSLNGLQRAPRRRIVYTVSLRGLDGCRQLDRASDSLEQSSTSVPWVCYFTGPDEMPTLEHRDIPPDG